MERNRWLWLYVMTCALSLFICRETLAQVAKPVIPDEGASPEEWDKFHEDLHRYINYVTRQRYGKRSIPDTLISSLVERKHRQPS